MSDARTSATAAGTSDRWDGLAALFEGALARSVEEREAWLRDQTAVLSVVAEIHGLLAGCAAGSGPLDRVMAALGPPAGGWEGATVPTRVGPYEVLREIGRGGMGVVYLARRADGEYQRLVALKLARAPVLDPSLRARFLAERDILAGLAHPNIAPLFDAGVTDDGLPYFTMEYVDGATIDAHCDRQRLDLRARIRLFLRICGAVAAAHRALVVHRDLKPTNVIVTAGGEAKLLDFGIAKLLEADAPAPGQSTATDARLMTPAYASPEQVSGRPVSTATDVYALGLLLYELLSGRRAHRFAANGLAELARVVAEVDPLPMSAAVASPYPGDETSAAAIAHARRSSPARLARLLRGDLERIAGMALRKDPEQRYASAAHLAEDLERYLDGQPVVAQGRSVLYRAGCFVRRHRLVVVAAAIAALSLAGYAVLAARHARDLAVAADRERQESARAREVADFVVGLFDGADPNVVQNSSVPVTQMLEQGLAKANALSAQPLLQARLLNAIGRVYFNLGRYDEAAAVARQALDLSRRSAGDQHADVARDYRLLGLVTGALGQPGEGAEWLRAALAIHQREGGAPVEAATDMHHLGYALAQSGRLDEAEQQVVGSLTAQRALLPPDHADIVSSLSTLAFIRRRQGHPRDAADLYREALAIAITRLGDRHPEVARTRQNLATMLSDAGVYDEAAQEMTRALDTYRAVYGERHPSIATTLNNLALLEGRRQRGDASAGYFRASFEMRRELLGPDHPSTLLSQSNLASQLGLNGQWAEGEAMLRDILARLGDTDVAMGPSKPQTMANLAHILRLQGRLADGEALAREALDLGQRHALEPLAEASVRGTLGTILLARQRHAEAAEVLERAVAIRRERLGETHANTVRLQRELDEARRRRDAAARP